ncbi:SRPBCC domain-containing protein [Methylomonas methanica]|nr:SRPBCC domain-containing protein [Methylomonas methanica]
MLKLDSYLDRQVLAELAWLQSQKKRPMNSKKQILKREMSTFTTTRNISAEPSAIFAAIKDPNRLVKWWGPSGFSNRFEEFEFKPGGKWVFDMVGPDGTVYPNESVFEKIETGRLVVIRHVCQPHFTLSITLEPVPEGTLVHWQQLFVDASVANTVRHIVEPSNEQNLDRLTAEVIQPA